MLIMVRPSRTSPRNRAMYRSTPLALEGRGRPVIVFFALLVVLFLANEGKPSQIKIDRLFSPSSKDRLGRLL